MPIFAKTYSCAQSLDKISFKSRESQDLKVLLICPETTLHIFLIVLLKNRIIVQVKY